MMIKMAETTTEKVKNYVPLQGEIIELFKNKKTFNIVFKNIINNTDMIVLTTWDLVFGEQLEAEIKKGDTIFCNVWDYKGKNEHFTMKYGESVNCYILHSKENEFAVNNRLLIEMDPGQFKKNIEEYSEAEMNADIESVEKAQETIATLPLKNVQVVKPKIKEQDKEVIIPEKKKEMPIVEFNKDELAFTKSSVPITFNSIKKYFDAANYCTDEEIIVFWVLCKHYQLDPFKKDIYIIKYSKNGKAAYVVSKDLFLSRAELQGDYLGFQAGIITEYETETAINEKMRDGSYLPKSEKLVGGWAKIFRKNKQDFTHTVTFDEYNKPSSDKTKPNSWDKIPATMIRKVAIVQAIRECYPNYFAQLYDASEMGVELPKIE